jgi:NAD(P)-dependent dehydrogenase (short-subunit alcohol dehydrogenase family)
MLTDHGLYMITKAALNRVTVYLSQYLKPFNIAINALSPGSVATEGLIDRVPEVYRTKSGLKFPEPSVAQVRNSIVTLAAQDASGITGQITRVDNFVDVA